MMKRSGSRDVSLDLHSVEYLKRKQFFGCFTCFELCAFYEMIKKPAVSGGNAQVVCEWGDALLCKGG